MAIHIQMSEKAERELKRSSIRNKISSLLACILFVGGGGLILTLTVIFIAAEPPPEFLVYYPPAEERLPIDEPMTPQLSSKAASPADSVAPTVIVSTAVAPVSMAPVEVPMDDSVGVGVSVELGMGLRDGLGNGLGEDGSGLGTGKTGGSALVGTFYDLKQTRKGSPTGIVSGGAGEGKVLEVLNGFLRNWSESALNKYYRAPQKLYASNFYVPVAYAKYGPIAYGVADKVKEGAWVAIYRGRVRAPKSGKFRFVGTGDECVAVRFNCKTVLEAGYRIPSRWPDGAKVSGADHVRYAAAIKAGTDSVHKDYEFIKLNGIDIWNAEVGGLTAGTVFEVEEGKVYPIEVMITEVPGGKFGVMLFMEDMSENLKPDNPSNQYHLFRTNFSTPDETVILELLQKAGCNVGNSLQVPKYNPESLIWVVVP